jgi:acetylornithine deacetylase/succinyl-diaminopimelate desuccinylase-like protein
MRMRSALGVALVLAAPLLSAQTRSPTKFTPAMADRADVKQALGYIDAGFDTQVAEWIMLTEIPALSTHEQKRAAYLQGELQKLGLAATIDPMGNVMARRAGTGGGPAILFVAHMDTVHPMDTDVKVKRLPDGTLHAPGVFDDTEADIDLLQAVRAMNAAKIKTKGDIIILFSVQEELGLKGMYYWFDHNPKAAEMIVAVDSELGTVNYGALGIYWSKMQFTAPGAHTLNSRGQPNPVRAAAQCITDIYTVPLPPADAAVPAIYNVGGMMGSGTVVNAIPPQVWFTVDLRTIDAALLKQLDAQIVSKCEAAATVQKVTFAREYIQKSEAGGRPDQLTTQLASPVVQTALGVLQFLGVKLLPRAPEATGSTDANVGVVHGVPSVAVGRSAGGNQHSLSEWADIASAKIGTKQLLLLAVSLAEPAGG